MFLFSIVFVFVLSPFPLRVLRVSVVHFLLGLRPGFDRSFHIIAIVCQQRCHRIRRYGAQAADGSVGHREGEVGDWAGGARQLGDVGVSEAPGGQIDGDFGQLRGTDAAGNALSA